MRPRENFEPERPYSLPVVRMNQGKPIGVCPGCAKEFAVRRGQRDGLLAQVAIPHCEARCAQGQCQTLLAFPKSAFRLYSLGSVLQHADEILRLAVLIAH